MFEKLQRDYSGLYGKQQSDVKRPLQDDDGRPRVSEFFERWGWEYSVSLCVQDSGLSEDDIYNWNVLRFASKLSYLKDKGKFEISLNGSK